MGGKEESDKPMLKTLWVEKRIDYDGTQMRPQWTYKNFGLEGDNIVAFIGGCEVKEEEMLDLEDLSKGEKIRAKLMLHFICEHFEDDLLRTIMRQRLLVCCAKECLEKQGLVVERRGDDLFCGNRKLSVSIASKTLISCKIHLGINIDPEGAPVPAIGLKELNVPPEEFAKEVLDRYKRETEDIYFARCKVKGIP